MHCRNPFVFDVNDSRPKPPGDFLRTVRAAVVGNHYFAEDVALLHRPLGFADAGVQRYASFRQGITTDSSTLDFGTATSPQATAERSLVVSCEIIATDDVLKNRGNWKRISVEFAGHSEATKYGRLEQKEYCK